MNQGFIQSIIIIVLLLVIVSLLGVSLTSVYNNNTLQENFNFVGKGIVSLWTTYGKIYFVKTWGMIKMSFNKFEEKIEEVQTATST